VQLPGHPGALGGDGLLPVQLGQPHALFGLPPGCLGGLPVAAHQGPGGRRAEADQADRHTEEERLRSSEPGDEADGRRHRERSGADREPLGGGPGTVPHCRAHQVGEHQHGCQAATAEPVPDEGERAERQRGERPDPAQDLQAGGHGQRHQHPGATERPTDLEAQADPPEQQPTNQAGGGD
jgi:hypothetical protein